MCREREGTSHSETVWREYGERHSPAPPDNTHETIEPLTMRTTRAGLNMPPTRPLEERFWEKVRQDGDDNLASHWLWVGATSSNGYGHIRDGKRERKAHRVAWEQFFDTIPDGLVIDHLCRVRNCVNPYHLEPVTGAVNAARSVRGERGSGGWGGRPKQRHCTRGHELSSARRRKDGTRECVPCGRLRRIAREAAA